MGTALERRAMFPRFIGWFEMPEWMDIPDFGRFFERDRFSDVIRVEETRNDDHLIIKAEMPGIDPDHDVEITVANGVLTIKAERREEKHEDSDGRTRSEFRYGSFQRTVRVPAEAKTSDVIANYKDGILTISVPVPKTVATAVVKVPVGLG